MQEWKERNGTPKGGMCDSGDYDSLEVEPGGSVRSLGDVMEKEGDVTEAGGGVDWDGCVVRLARVEEQVGGKYGFGKGREWNGRGDGGDEESARMRVEEDDLGREIGVGGPLGDVEPVGEMVGGLDDRGGAGLNSEVKDADK